MSSTRFVSDQPIAQISEDHLNREAFCEAFAQAFVAFPQKESFVVALQGKWGSGKTSILNMTKQKIEEINKDLPYEERMITIPFNPCNCTDTDQLIRQFFITLCDAIEINDKDKKWGKVGDALTKYSSAFEFTKYIPVVGEITSDVLNGVSSVGKSICEVSDKKVENISYQKERVEEALMEFSGKILIIIDDIDRLPNNQIRLIFQLVHAIAGFPNTIYLLSYDPEIVVRALEEIHQNNGREYLDKIVQVPFDVPPLPLIALKNEITAYFEPLIGEAFYTDFDHERWSLTIKNILLTFMHSVRDLKRLYICFLFSWYAVKDEANFIDLLLICMLKTFSPSIYSWVFENRESLIDDPDRTFPSEEVYWYNKEKEIEALCPALPSSVFETLVLLFPSSNKLVDTDNEYSKYSLSKDPNTNYIEKRICSPRYFNIYFTLSLDSIMVPSRKIDASLTTMSKDELKDFLNSVTDQHLLSNYLEDINVKSLKIGTNVRLIRSFGTMPKTVGCSLYKGHPFLFIPHV